ncbi:MAG: hypothetical protein FWG98_13975 [Candidatus Cloacimonetes bacterium]|nr:hypothetical protein [Candidatus Cloacimonadota bacterium]
MKKLFIVFILLLIGALNAQSPSADDNNIKGQRFYLDAGIGSDFVIINFKQSNHGFRSEKIEGLIGSTHDFFKGPTLNLKLGYRLSDRAILITNYQTIYVRESFFYKVNLGTIQEKNYLLDYRMDIKPDDYLGFGMIIYPHPRFQLSTTLGFVRAGISSEGLPSNLYPPFTIYPYSSEIRSSGSIFNAGYEVSLVYDIPAKKTGILIGWRLFYAPRIDYISFIPTYTDPPDYSITLAGLFVKIRY